MIRIQHKQSKKYQDLAYRPKKHEKILQIAFYLA